MLILFKWFLSLGGYHDGAGDPYNYTHACDPTENYILSSIAITQNLDNLINQYIFSSCSVQAFKRTLFIDLTFRFLIRFSYFPIRDNFFILLWLLVK